MPKNFVKTTITNTTKMDGDNRNGGDTLIYAFA